MSHDERHSSPLRGESPSPRSVDGRLHQDVDEDRQRHDRYSLHDDRRVHAGRAANDGHDLRQRDDREARDDHRYHSDDDHDVSDSRHHHYPEDHAAHDHGDEPHNRLENHQGDRHEMKERDERDGRDGRDGRDEQYSLREPLPSSPGRELVSNEENDPSRQDASHNSPPGGSNSLAMNEQPSGELNGGTTLVNLFVRNVAKHVLEDQLIGLFSKYGKVESAVVVRDPHSRECRGFGFVKMMSEKDAQNAIDNLQDFEFEGRQISVERAKRNGPHSRTPGAYMGLDRRIRDRYVGMKRTREYAYAYGPPYPPPPPPHYAPYRGPRYHDGPRPRYDYRQMQAQPPAHDYNRPPMNQRYDQRGPVDDRDRQRRRYDTDGPRYSPREAPRDQRIDGRDPPVPRESADDVI